MAKFEWNPVELQCRILALCREFGIPNAIVVWDHGHCKFATRTTVGGVDLVILFSGLSKRADDIIVKEAAYLQAGDCVGTYSSDTAERAPIGIVTNDRGLVMRLLPLSNRSSTQESPTPATSRSNDGPLIIDSTSFVELLFRCSDEDNIDQKPFLNHPDTQILLRNLQEVRDSLKTFSKQHKIGYNPRREKTWERCVVAETMRRTYISLPWHVCDNRHADENNYATNERNGDHVFATQYLRELETRGFFSPMTRNPRDFDKTHETAPISGPTRLEKRQKKLLGRYNKARQKAI